MSTKDDHLPTGGCGKPGHVTSQPDPSEGEAATLYCVTCEAEAKQAEQSIEAYVEQHSERVRAMNDAPCGHVPARPDVDLTLCWKCGVEIIPDPATHLWRPLTVTEKLVKYETTRQLRELFFQVHHSEYSKILFERLEHKDKPAIRLAESIMGHWIIVNGQSDDLAWSGSRWVPHHHGLPVIGQESVQICNFQTREEAKAYANQTFPQVDIERDE
jgi:hypothetical protein